MIDRRRAPSVGILGALLLSLLMVAPARADHVGDVDWLDPEEGFEKARQTGRPVMLYFSADW